MIYHEHGYREVISWIRQQIKNGSLKEGDRLPAEAELARQFSLSRQTVRHGITELEKEKVLMAVRGSGTYVGAMKRKENDHRHMSVAVMLTYGDSYIFPPVLRGITEVLSQAGCTAQISFTDNSVVNEEKILRSLLKNDDVDALIAEPSKGALPNPNLHYYDMLKKHGIPVLLINAAYPACDIPSIRMDDKYIGKKAVKLLFDAGHRDIGGIFHCEDEQGILRYTGFMEEAGRLGLKIKPEHIVWIDTVSVSDLAPAAELIMERIKDCTGIMAYNDEVACQMIKLCQSHGMTLPRDLSVIGVDDADPSATIIPSLTTFQHPKALLGKKAADSILKMIDYPSYDGSYIFSTEPVIRKSVMNIAGQ